MNYNKEMRKSINRLNENLKNEICNISVSEDKGKILDSVKKYELKDK